MWVVTAETATEVRAEEMVDMAAVEEMAMTIRPPAHIVATKEEMATAEMATAGTGTLETEKAVKMVAVMEET